MSEQSHSHPRSQRVSTLIQRELSIILSRELKDPRLPTVVSISAVEVSRSLSNARVYISVIDEKNDIAGTLSILNNASGLLRGHLAKAVSLKYMPKLHFVYDHSLVEGARLDKLIDSLDQPNSPSNHEDSHAN